MRSGLPAGDGRSAASTCVAGDDVATTTAGDVVFADGDGLRRVDAVTGLVATLSSEAFSAIAVDTGTLSHLGIRYTGTADVASEMARVKQAEVPLFQQEGTTCCYAKADKFWVKDCDGIPWEMYSLLEDVQAETAADPQLRAFLGQEGDAGDASLAPGAGCCVPKELTPEATS